MTQKKTVSKSEHIVITPPRFDQAVFRIRGTAPYVQHKFSQKARNEILKGQEAPGGKSRKKREPRDIKTEYAACLHIGEDDRYGIPCSGFRSALIDACRAAGYVMTKAKMSVFCLADTIDADEGTPLVHIEGTHEPVESAVRLESGTASVAVRPMWRKWSAAVRLQWDADQFGLVDIANLLTRAGIQVGVGEGRPFSKKSNGMGWGTFEIVNDEG